MSERCREMEELLSPWRDGELDPNRAREVAEHVADCAACQAKVSAWHEAEAALAGSVPSRSDLEWESLAQRVEDAIDADELARIAETLPAGEETDEVAAVRAAAAAPAAAGMARTAPAGPRAAPPRRNTGWWAVGSGLAAAALVVLFWPWFQRTTEVAPGPGALRQRVGAAGRIETAQKGSPAETGKPDQLGELRQLDELEEADPFARVLADADGFGANEGDAAQPEKERPAAAPPPALEKKNEPAAPRATGTVEPEALRSLGYLRDTGGVDDEGIALEEAAPLDGREIADAIDAPAAAGAPGAAETRSRELAGESAPATVAPAAPQGADGIAEVVAWMSSDTFRGAEPTSRSDAKLLRLQDAPEPPASTTPEAALQLAHEARDRGERARAEQGYRLLAGDFPGNTVRESAWYSLLDLQIEDVRAGASLAATLETAASLEAFREEYPDSRYARGVLASRVFAWARLVELDPSYCEEAGARVQDWQVGVEMAPLDVMRAVATIADGCAR